MDELAKLLDQTTQARIRSYSTRRVMVLLNLPTDIERDMDTLALECGYQQLARFIEDLCIATVFQWRERAADEQGDSQGDSQEGV